MKYEELVYKHFDVKSVSGREAMCICIWHDDSNASMQVNLDSALWICFSCDARGGPKTLFKEVGLDINTGEEQTDINDVLRKIIELRKNRPEVHEKIYPESYLSQFDLPLNYWQEGRDLSEATVKAFQLGYDPFTNSATIPLRNVDGELLGVIRRKFEPNFDEGESRYMYPKGFKRTHHMFNDWSIEKDSSATRVVLTEGSLDAIRVCEAGFNGMAIYGSSISEAQVRLLRRLGVLRVTLFFDDDKAGEKARDRCLGKVYHRRKGQVVQDYRHELDLRRFFIVDYVRYPSTSLASHKEGEEAFDPGDMKLDDIRELLRKTVKTI